jgi:hypothetical protein
MERPFSTVLRVRVRMKGGEVGAFVKQLKTSGTDLARMRRRVQREFDTTDRIYRVLAGDGGFSVVRPVACFPEALVLVTERASGVTLARFITGWRPVPASTRLERARGAGTRLGAWLRAFQDTACVNEGVSLDGLRSYLDVRLEQLLAAPCTGFTPDDRALMLARFDALADRVTAADLRCVPVHADLCPENVLVDEGRITVLDFSMAKTGTVFHDVSHLFMHLELLRMRRRVRGHVLDALERAMLQGYDPDLRPDRPLFALMLLQHVICHLAGLAERSPGATGRFRAWYLRRQLGRSFRLLSQAETTSCRQMV